MKLIHLTNDEIEQVQQALYAASFHGTSYCLTSEMFRNRVRQSDDVPEKVEPKHCDCDWVTGKPCSNPYCIDCEVS